MIYRKRKLSITHATEIISEVFDDALNHLDDLSIAFGGAIRDIIAGDIPSTDLDIAYSEGSNIFLSFNTSSKWEEVLDNSSNTVMANTAELNMFIPGYDPTIKEKPSREYWGVVCNDPHNPPPLRPEAVIEGKNRKFIKNPGISLQTLTKGKPFALPVPKPRYKTQDKIISINKTTVFMSKFGTKAQLVFVESDKINSYADQILHLVYTTDLTCCGVFLDRKGDVWEVIEGAEEDCKNKILKINPYAKTIDLERLKSRIKKLESRGWTSHVDLNEVRRKNDEEKRKEEKEKRAKNKELHKFIKEKLLDQVITLTENIKNTATVLYGKKAGNKQRNSLRCIIDSNTILCTKTDINTMVDILEKYLGNRCFINTPKPNTYEVIFYVCEDMHTEENSYIIEKIAIQVIINTLQCSALTLKLFSSNKDLEDNILMLLKESEKHRSKKNIVQSSNIIGAIQYPTKLSKQSIYPIEKPMIIDQIEEPTPKDFIPEYIKHYRNS